ncbi:MAG: FAD-binding oxidoreductase [Vicinamibacterales bacterium]
MPLSMLNEAVREWERALGVENVTLDAAVLRNVSTATFATTARVGAVIRPGNTEEVQRALRIANRFRIPLYPIASGKNWGYGSRAPVRDGVLLDLGRMNRILAFDEDLAYVTIEPGVTQRQLQSFLRERKSSLWMDATGASPDCSIVGNTMERGFGHTPLGDHAGNACGFEVVLPTGERIETGFSRFEGSKTGPLSRWGVGPSLDGLFTQSNFGIVTRMSVWLMPAPERFEAFFFLTRKEDGLADIVDALRPLRLNGTLRSTIHIGNDYKVLTATSRFPWADDSVAAPLDGAAMTRLRKTLSIGYWNGSGGLYGTRGQVKEAKRQIRRALAGKVDRLQFVDDRLLRLMARFSTPFRMLTGWDISKTLKVLDPVYNLMKGVPTESTLGSAYWRKREDPLSAPDPDRDGCGLLWCSPVVPSTGKDVRAATTLASRIVLAHGFEPQMSLSLATERSAICVTTISYDRHVPGEDARALACYKALTVALLEHGYPPYRLNIRSMDFAQGNDQYAGVIAGLKASLDPNGVLAPGRYERPVAVQEATPLPVVAVLR